MAASLPAVTAALEAGLAEGIAPAISAAVWRRGLALHATAHGAAVLTAPATLFDVASLTKVLCTTTLAAQAVAEGALDLDAPVARLVPGFAAGRPPGGAAFGDAAITPRHLLAHASGLPWWLPLHEAARRDPEAAVLWRPPAERPPFASLGGPFARSRAAALAALLAAPAEAPPGARAVYSDPGFVLLGLAVEAALGGRLPDLFEARVARPLGLASTCFVDGLAPAAALARTAGRAFAPTGWSAPRSEWLQGTVNDDACWALAGAAGHAGLFSTAVEVAALGQAWLDALDGQGSVVPASAAAAFARRDPTPGSTRALGWDTPSPQGSTLGDRLGRGPRGALGHLGYTGCSLWLDLDAGVAVALLTNHVHPAGPDKGRITSFRRRVHDAVAADLGIG